MNTMLKNRCKSIAECLDSNIKVYGKDFHHGDSGEMCEFFMKEFLLDFFQDIYRIFRGGSIINRRDEKSEQIDIVLCSRNSIKIFNDKGLYPIETVYGIVNVKKELNHTNLFSVEAGACGAIKNILSLPLSSEIRKGMTEKETIRITESIPYKIVFAYSGKIIDSWADDLTAMVIEDLQLKERLPDIIVVNKQGIIEKKVDMGSDGKVKHFWYTDMSEDNFYLPFSIICRRLYENSMVQNMVSCEYEAYFD